MDQYITTYQHDYLRREITCPMGAHRMRVDPSVEPGTVDCKARRTVVGEATGRQYEKPPVSCRCGQEKSQPPRAMGGGGMTGMQIESAGATASRPPNLNKEELAEMMYKAAETGNVKLAYTPCGNKPNINPLHQPCAAGKIPRHTIEPISCPKQEKFRPVPIGQFGGHYEGPLNRENEESLRVNEQAMPYKFDKPCYCPPGKPESGPQDYGPAWIRSRAEEEPIGLRMTGGKPVEIRSDVAKLINPATPAARVSCAPEADVSRFDQPNTFMRKLYEKYPYLYQILRDTPPEELIARVFKDRFLSTYQVDYLHMGVGKESYQKGGEQMNEKFVSPEGEPEPNMIPGRTYRPSKKEAYAKTATVRQTTTVKQTTAGKKATDLKMKEREEEKEEEIVVKEEPRISEYMASISKLGGEIISDRLYFWEAKNKAAAAAAGKNFQ